MAKKDEEKKFTGNEPAYIRALRETKANMPKILDKETGVERDVFSPAPTTNDKPKSKVDELMEKLGHGTTKKADNGPKMAATQRVTIPAWLCECMDRSGISSLNLGDMDMLAKLTDLAALQGKKFAMSFVIDPTNKDLTVFTTGEEAKLTEKQSEIVAKCVRTLGYLLLPDLGIEKAETFCAEQVKAAAKSPAKGNKKDTTKKPTGKKTDSKKKTAPNKKEKSA